MKKLIASVAAIFLLGTAAPSTAVAQIQTAVEYYYSAWNFYFVTSFPAEIAALDGGAFGGAWKRTGQTFDVWAQPTAGALPTCRFFSTMFAPRSAHFYTPYAAECASLKAGAGWQYEADAFYLQLPDANGNCAPGTTILYRLYNNGMGGAPNHRFTTDAATFDQMQAAGWIFEGDGRTGAFACVPASSSPPPATAEGMWAGTTSHTSEFLLGWVLDDGTYYFTYSSPTDLGLVQGTATSSNGQFTSSNAVDINFAGLGARNAAVSGTYVAQSSLNGAITSTSGTTTFGAVYSSLYEQPASLSAAAGTYSVSAGTGTGGGDAVITLSATGALSGSAPGCSFTGTLVPRGGVNVFNLSITFVGAGCGFGMSTLFGIAYYDAATAQLFALAPNAARTDGFIAIGPKQ
jgi:hypothetical protein